MICLFVYYFGIVWMSMREVFISRKSSKGFENTIQIYALVDIFKATQWARLESLMG